MKQCSRCGQKKPLTDFQIRRRSADGRQVYCRPCSTVKGREWRGKNRERQRTTDRARYAANPGAGAERTRRYRKRHPERVSILRRKATLAAHGLTPQNYRAMLEEQDHRCAICQSEDPGHWSGRFVVDHDHGTRVVRGLLCASCNIGLGYFEDDPARLAAAIAYLLGLPSEGRDTQQVRRGIC